MPVGALTPNMDGVSSCALNFGVFQVRDIFAAFIEIVTHPSLAGWEGIGASKPKSAGTPVTTTVTLKKTTTK